MNVFNWIGFAQDAGVLALALVTPWLDVPAARRLRARPDSAARLALYRRGFCALWIGLVCVLTIAGPARVWTVARAADEWTWLDHPLGAGAAILLCAGFFVIALWPGILGLRGPAARARLARSVEPLAFFLPASPLERRWWAALSVSAGVCEEFVMRGFLIQYFRGALDGSLHLGLTPAVLLAGAIFGLNHAYQGTGGVLRTALAGLVFALLTILTGNLLLPIVLHALADLVALAIHRPDEDARVAARAAAQAL